MNMAHKTVISAALLIVAVAYTLMNVQISLFVQDIINFAVYGVDDIMWRRLAILAGLLIAMPICKYASIYTTTKTLNSIKIKMLSLFLTDSNFSGERSKILTYMKDDLGRYSSFLLRSLPDLFMALLAIVIMPFVLMQFEFLMGIVAILCALVYGLSVFFSKPMQELETQIRAERESAVSKLSVIFSLLPLFSVYSSTINYVKHYKKNIDAWHKHSKKLVFLRAFYLVLMIGSNLFREMLIIILGISGGFQIGTIIALVNISSFTSSAFSRLADVYVNWKTTLPAARQIHKFTKAAAPARAKESKSKIKISPPNRLAIEGLTFAYNGGPPVLDNVSAVFNKGEISVLSGSIGTGKSTLIKLLLNFYQGQKGGICIDGVSYADLTDEHITEMISYTNQQSTFFDGTILENIVCFEKTYDRQKVEKLLEQMNLLDDINALPNGLGTKISDSGFKLSGGQMQRLSIARALYKDSPVIVLDEITSSLDSENEQKIIDIIQKIKRGKILVCVAHSPNFIKAADKLFEIKGGALFQL